MDGFIRLQHHLQGVLFEGTVVRDWNAESNIIAVSPLHNEWEVEGSSVMGVQYRVFSGYYSARSHRNLIEVGLDDIRLRIDLLVRADVSLIESSSLLFQRQVPEQGPD